MKVWEIHRISGKRWYLVKGDSIVRFRTRKEAEAYARQYSDKYVVVTNGKEYIYPGLGLEEQFII